MSKKILQLKGAKELAKKEQQVILGGRKERMHCVGDEGCMEYGSQCVEPECFWDPNELA